MPSSVASPRYRRGYTGSPPDSASGSSHAYTLNPATSSPKVVTRLALDGKVKHGQDNASMRMYLKISIPFESAIPASTIQLFPEDDVKILSSVVHPLDSTSAPYSFSSKTSPLLHNAAHALNLPQRLPQSYLSLFHLSYSQAPSHLGAMSRTSSNGLHPPLLDEKYTGHILVSGYSVSFVLPKEFPDIQDSQHNSSRTSSFPSSHRRKSSVGDRGTYQFMAAIDMLVPLRTRPPRAPYMLCLPIPRCLSNNIKLRIFSPTPTSASYASLSSAEDDPGSWDLTCDPHVTRSASRHARQSSYARMQYADDESSDSSTAGFSEGSGLQGTFPSTDQVRIRWASAARGRSGSSRRRVGVSEVKGETTYTVLGKSKMKATQAEAVVLKLDYKVTLKDVWYAGVATLLGLDMSLDTNSCELAWPDNAESRWTVSGGAGFTGWDAGDGTSAPPLQSSPDSVAQALNHPGLSRNRVESSSSTSSLLRAPLMTPPVPDYSFESATSTPTGSMISSLESLRGPSGSELSRQPSYMASPSMSIPETCEPASALTIHLDMNELLEQPARSGFTLQITGTVLVLPRFPASTLGLDDTGSTIPVVGLPRFRVTAAERENVQFIVKNEAVRATVEVFNRAGDLDDAQTRKTVLQSGASTRCGIDGGRVALRPVHVPSYDRTPSRYASDDEGLAETATPNLPMTPANPPRSRRGSVGASVRRSITNGLLSQAPPVISHMRIMVTPIISQKQSVVEEYVVSTTFAVPADMEGIEFGIAHSSKLATVDHSAISIGNITASVDGMPAVTAAVSNMKVSGLGILGVDKALDDMGRKDWLAWINVPGHASPGSAVTVSYAVKLEQTSKTRIGHGYEPVPLFLTSFPLPINRLDLDIEKPEEFVVESIGTHNFSVQRSSGTGLHLTRFSTHELFRPAIAIQFTRPDIVSVNPNVRVLKRVLQLLPTLVVLLLLIRTAQLQQQIQALQEALATRQLPTAAGLPDVHVPSPITSYIFDSATIPTPTSGPLRWNADATEDVNPPSSTTSLTPPPTAQVAEPPRPVDEVLTPITTVALSDTPPLAALPPPPALPEWSPIPDQAIGFPAVDLNFLRQLYEKLRVPRSEDVPRVVMKQLKTVWRWWQVVINYPMPPP